MEVNVKQALKMFFSKSSFEMIYFEAFANALDAGATEFSIDIVLPDVKDVKNLTLTISDNGAGFDDVRYGKFAKLFDVEEQTHKGLGRLVYLCYFDKVYIQSVYEEVNQRTFVFTENFKTSDNQVTQVAETVNGSVLKLSGFSGVKLHSINHVTPSYIKKVLLENFYMKFYQAKLDSKTIAVSIRLCVNGKEKLENLSTDDLPNFSVVQLTEKLDLFNKMELYYHIKEVPILESNVITALAVDERTHKIDIIAGENLPNGYEMIFLLISESFKGGVDESRMNLAISESELAVIKTLFRQAISKIIKEQCPQIQKENEKQQKYLNDIYPHLSGYFENSEIGYSSQTEVLKKAQDKFFRDQKEILSATELTAEQFEKSLDLSSRTLAEYILFRQNVIKRMRALSEANKEADIHNLLVPQYSESYGDKCVTDLYRNNVWVLDDKFMSYDTILSEMEMTKVVEVLTQGEVHYSDADRPDVAIFFSDYPNSLDKKFDVVIVELKRLGISAENNSIVEFQLDTRTRRLAKYYGNRIQRMWFYGVVDFTDEYREHLVDNQYIPLYSKGEIYYRIKPVYDLKNGNYHVLQHSYIMDFKALVNDADARNATFLKILRSKFSQNH